MNYDLDNLLEYKGYMGTVEFSLEDNVFHGRVVGIDGLISYEGQDLKNLKSDFEEAIEAYFEMCEEAGIKPQKPYYSRFTVEISPSLHKRSANVTAKHSKSINEAVEEALTHYITA